MASSSYSVSMAGRFSSTAATSASCNQIHREQSPDRAEGLEVREIAARAELLHRLRVGEEVQHVALVLRQLELERARVGVRNLFERAVQTPTPRMISDQYSIRRTPSRISRSVASGNAMMPSGNSPVNSIV